MAQPNRVVRQGSGAGKPQQRAANEIEWGQDIPGKQGKAIDLKKLRTLLKQSTQKSPVRGSAHGHTKLLEECTRLLDKGTESIVVTVVDCGHLTQQSSGGAKILYQFEYQKNNPRLSTTMLCADVFSEIS